jgi:hypothetical protein
VQLEGALPGPSQRLGARHPPRLRLRYEVAPPLCLAQDAVSLKLLPETTQKMFLRFALAELYKQVVSFLIAGQRRCTAAAPAFARVAAVPDGTGPLVPAARGRPLGEAVPTVDRAVASGLEWDLGLLATLGANHRVHLTG